MVIRLFRGKLSNSLGFTHFGMRHILSAHRLLASGSGNETVRPWFILRTETPN